MGALTVTLPQSLIDRMDAITRSTDLPKDMLDAAIDVMEPELHRRLHVAIRHKDKSKGALDESITRSPPRFTVKGEWRSALWFKGYDENGIPNDRKAMSMEWGTSKQLAAPFIRPTKEAKLNEAVEAMEKVFHEAVNP